jgi:gamma-glutamylcyclotransferase (GGCT)/AIG2-like uncharacterized protein YtfP
VLYFAYASNMHRAQMQRWCPASRFLGPASLAGFRFVYDGFSVTWDGAVANIVKSDAETVWGVLYEVTERDRLTLDSFEGYPRDYEHRDVDVRDRDGNVRRAMTYFRTGRPLGPPHPDYERIVIDGAKESGLPDDYIDRTLRVARL